MNERQKRTFLQSSINFIRFYKIRSMPKKKEKRNGDTNLFDFFFNHCNIEHYINIERCVVCLFNLKRMIRNIKVILFDSKYACMRSLFEMQLKMKYNYSFKLKITIVLVHKSLVENNTYAVIYISDIKQRTFYIIVMLYILFIPLQLQLSDSKNCVTIAGKVQT